MNSADINYAILPNPNPSSTNGQSHHKTVWGANPDEKFKILLTLTLTNLNQIFILAHPAGIIW